MNKAFWTMNFIFSFIFVTSAYGQAGTTTPVTTGGVATVPPVTKANSWVKPEYRDYKDELNGKKLAAQKLEVNAGVLFDISDPAAPVSLGKLRVIDAKYAFQWADKETHDSYIDAGGLSAEFIKEVIAEPGQASGKGFYVSFDPVDSASYGDSLTVFSPKISIVALEYGSANSVNTKVNNDTAFVQRLSDAGIHGLRTENYMPTWICIINSAVLTKARNISKELYLQFLSGPQAGPFLANETFDSYKKFVTPTSVSVAFYKFLNDKELNIDEITQIKNNISFQSGVKMQTKLYKLIFNVLMKADQFDQKVLLIKLLNGMFCMPEIMQSFQQDLFKDVVSENGIKFKKILDVFDLQFITHRKQEKFFVAGLEKYARKYLVAKDKAISALVPLADIDILALMHSIFGKEFKARENQTSEKRLLSYTQQYYINQNLLMNFTQPTPVTMSQVVDYSYANLVSIAVYRDAIPSLSKELEDFVNTQPMDLTSPAAKDLQARALVQFSNLILKGGGAYVNVPPKPAVPNTVTKPGPLTAYDPGSKLRAIIALHPFATNDKTMLSALYEALTKQSGRVSPSLDFPMYDIALTVTDYDSLLLAGTLLKRWIVNAKDDADFLNRSKEAMKIFLAAYPEMKAMYPEMEIAP